MPGIFSVKTRPPPGRMERRTYAPPSCSTESSLPALPAATIGSWVTNLVFVARVVRSFFAGFFLDHVQRQFAALIDFSNLNLELLSDRNHVFDVFDALTTHELADLGDVQQDRKSTRLNSSHVAISYAV